MPVSNSRNVEGTVHRNLFFILVAAVTLVFFGMIGPFLLTVLWAIVLAIIFYGLYRWILRRIGYKRQSLASFATCLLVVLFVLIPFVLLTFSLIGQATDLYKGVQAGDVDPNTVINYVEESLPTVAGTLEQYGVRIEDIRERVNGYIVQAGQMIAGKALSFGGNILNVIIQFTLMLYLLFFFLKDGKKIVRKLVQTIPLGNIRERALVQRFAQVSRATLKGTVIVAMTQGAIGGILFWIVGIQAPVLWGVAMTFLALLPVGGSAIIWVPAAIILGIEGDYVGAIVIVVVGSLIIGLVDNILRPVLVGRDTEMPDYLVLISTLGGIAYFGLSGFVVGPTIAALLITVWEMMGKEFGGRSAK